MVHPSLQDVWTYLPDNAKEPCGSQWVWHPATHPERIKSYARSCKLRFQTTEIFGPYQIGHGYDGIAEARPVAVAYEPQQIVFGPSHQTKAGS
jgi:hypothetical protein